jgi:hypothetical protein
MPTIAIAAEAAFPDETAATAQVTVSATDLVRRYGQGATAVDALRGGLSDNQLSGCGPRGSASSSSSGALPSCAWGASLSPRRSRCFPMIDPKRRGPGASELRSAIGSAFTSGSAMKTRSRGSACASSSPVYA